MDTEKKSFLAEFSRKAMQRLQDKKVPRYQTLHIPSMDADLKIRSLTNAEIMECLKTDDNDDPNRSDKYCIYLAAVEPSLKDTANEIMKAEAELPAEQRTLREPLDIMNIFDFGEIQSLAKKVMELSGVLNTKEITVVEQLKN